MAGFGFGNVAYVGSLTGGGASPLGTGTMLGHAQYSRFPATAIKFPAMPANVQTISMWFRKATFPNGDEYLFDCRTAANTDYSRGICLPGLTQGITITIDGINRTADGIDPIFADNYWHKLVLQAVGVPQSTLLSRYTNQSFCTNTDLAQLRLYNRPLTTAELANATNDFPADAVGMYDPYTATASQLLDTSGNGYHLAITGAAPMPLTGP